MRTRQGETFDWGCGFALTRLSSRPQEGSGEECGRGFGLGFFGKNLRQILKNLWALIINFYNIAVRINNEIDHDFVFIYTLPVFELIGSPIPK